MNSAKSGFGKHYSSMYQGSMVGAGSVVFAVMGYVISTQVPGEDGEMRLEMNPELLAFILGDTPKAVEGAIQFLCKPDAKSRTKEEGGRRLVKEGEFLYRVVNGAKYRAMGDPARRREQNREAKRRERERKKNPASGYPVATEAHYVKRMEEGASQEELDRISDGSIKSQGKPLVQVFAEEAAKTQNL